MNLKKHAPEGMQMLMAEEQKDKVFTVLYLEKDICQEILSNPDITDTMLKNNYFINTLSNGYCNIQIDPNGLNLKFENVKYEMKIIKDDEVIWSNGSIFEETIPMWILKKGVPKEYMALKRFGNRLLCIKLEDGNALFKKAIKHNLDPKMVCILIDKIESNENNLARITLDPEGVNFKMDNIEYKIL